LTDCKVTRKVEVSLSVGRGGEMKPNMSTQSVWAGEEQPNPNGTTQVPIAQSIAFTYEGLDEWQAVALGQAPGHIYSRNTNPTVAVFEAKMRELECAEAAVSFASGMAAISNALFTFLKPGDRLVSVKDTYGGTNELFRKFLPGMGVEVSLNETTDCSEIEADIDRGCRILYLETPTNPTLKVVDIRRLAERAHGVGAIVITDNTMATPVNQQPLTLGSDLVLNSASKFLGGHADALGGIVCGSKDLVGECFRYREITGAALDPFAAYLLIRGLKTLHLRIERQNSNAQAVAEFLESHPRVSRVNYPGLPSHPQHALAREQMTGGFGGVLSFVLDGGYQSVKQLLPKLRWAHRAANLGAVETTVGPPATTSHVEVSPEGRAAMGIPEALIRYSTGIESADDLIADLTQALDATFGGGRSS
jgi:cystathionine gamma-synthase